VYRLVCQQELSARHWPQVILSHFKEVCNRMVPICHCAGEMHSTKGNSFPREQRLSWRTDWGSRGGCGFTESPNKSSFRATAVSAVTKPFPEKLCGVFFRKSCFMSKIDPASFQELQGFLPMAKRSSASNLCIPCNQDKVHP
jgi:hypothetical protein